MVNQSRISVIVLTYNEADNIGACLDSVGWCDNVIVVDSFSTDDTRKIAEARGAKVVTNRFEDFAQQRNFAMSLSCVENDWVFQLDADERITPALHREMLGAIQSGLFSGYHVPSKMMLMGRWLKHAAGYPVYQVRLVNRREMLYTQKGHGQREGEALKGYGYLKEPYTHYSFSGGFEQWAHKHNRYSTMEAAQEMAGVPTSFGEVFKGDKTARRRALLGFSRRLPGRPFVRFIYMYLIKRGFVDGTAGFTYCALQAIYQYLIVLKVRESRLRLRGESL